MAMKNIIIFSCTSNILFLKDTKTFYMDGAFKYSVRFFTQMFTTHSLQNGNYMPIIFCLLLNKLTEIYVQTFHLILYIIYFFGRDIVSQYVTTELKNKIINTVNEIWPQTQIIRCLFHLT